MLQVLSIDWDFFIDATADQRCTLFPDGGNETLPKSIRDYIWDSYYRVPALEKIGVTEDYAVFEKICENNKGLVFIADSHAHLYDVVTGMTSIGDAVKIVNIDFHHDFYSFRTKHSYVNCGNWGTVLSETRPYSEVVWVKREDSETELIGGEEVAIEKIDMNEFKRTLLDVDYDVLFICKSSVWSPPHLDKHFVSAVSKLKELDYAMIFEDEPLEIRKYNADN